MPESFDEQTDFYITFWAKSDTNKIQTKTYENAIETFQKLYPNIHITLKIYTDYSRIFNDVITNITTQTTPNICVTYPDHIATYKTGVNVVLPLQEISSDKNFGLGGEKVKFNSISKDEIVPEFLSECFIDNVLYALPFMRSTEALYINKDFVEKLGYEIPEIVSWDFIWEVSERAMKKNDDNTFALNNQNVMIPFIYKSTDNMLIQYLAQKNAGYSSSAGDILIFNETTKNFLYEISTHAKSRSFSTFQISSYPGNFFNVGQCVFAVDSTAGATWIGTNAPLSDVHTERNFSFETVVMPIPQADEKNIKMISQGPSICIFNKSNPQEVLASWLFTQFLLTNQVQIPYSQTEGYVPVTLRAQNSDEYKDYLSKCGEDNDFYYDVKIKVAEMLLKNSSKTFVTPVFNGSASLRTAAGQLIENVCKAARRNEKVDDEFMQNNFESVTSLYRLNEIRKSDGENSKKDFGPLPLAAKILLATILFIWLIIIIVKIRSMKYEV